MLTELFIASVGVSAKAPVANVAKDATIFIQEYQPINAQRSIFKKSAAPPNCLAVSDSHVFAAQSDKAVVHVYNREKGNQEAIVPFTEHISCITLACNKTVLILGTLEGRIFLWEVASGRQVTTGQSHLQAVTALAVDPTSNFLLSASVDSTIHIWSLPSLLSFSSSTSSPVRTFTSHRSKVVALLLGHSSSFCNIAVSASNDKTCIVWDYFTHSVLRTYLLSNIPTSLAIDAADRGVYVGYEDGSVQLLDFFDLATNNIVHMNNVSKGTPAPIQPPPSSRWSSSDATVGSTLCLRVSFDGHTVISGHQSGVILVWDSARRGSVSSLLQIPLPGPVTNLIFLPVTGYTEERPSKARIHEVLKPKFGAFENTAGGVPGNYAQNFQLVSDIQDATTSEFLRMLDAPSFSGSVMDTGLNELLTWGKVDRVVDGDEDFMALDDDQEKPHQLSLEEQNMSLKSELVALRRLQRASFEKLERVNEERKTLVRREQKRSSRQTSSSTLAQVNGNHSTDQEEYASSSDGP